MEELIREFKTAPMHKRELVAFGFCRNNCDRKNSVPLDVMNVVTQYLIITNPGLTMDELQNISKKISKRMSKEIARIQKRSPFGDIRFTIHPQNYRYFLVEIVGPKDSVYQGGIFYGECFIPERYPIRPPKWRLLTPIYHPGIDSRGQDCLDILKSKWTPALTIERTMLSIQMLIQYPKAHIDDPMDSQIAESWKRNIKSAQKTAREWTKRYAQVNVTI